MGNVIPAYLDMLTKVTLRIQPACGQQASNPLRPLADGVSQAEDLAQALRTSLVRRLSHVLDDGHYVLGLCRQFFIQLASNSMSYLVSRCRPGSAIQEELDQVFRPCGVGCAERSQIAARTQIPRFM